MAITKVSSGVISANAVTATIVAENVITSSEIATDGVGTLQIADGAVTSAKLDTNIDIAGTLDVTGVLTADSNVVIAGNLTVNGSTVTNSSTNTTIEDALIELGTGTTGTPANDAGIIIERGDSNNAFMGFDESEDKFIVATTTATGSSTGDLTLTAAPLVTGALTASGLAYPTSDGSANQVIKTDGSGNLSFVTAITDGAVVHNYTATGDGSTVTFDTGINPQDEVNTWVHIDGVYQNKSEYSYNGTEITFTTAPDSGAAIDIITGNQNGFSTADSVLGVYSTTTTDTDTYDTGLSATNENNVNIFIEGVYQPKSTYTWSGSTITFDANTPTGLALEVIASKTLTSGAVVTASITDDAVTTAKIADNAITSAKIVNNSITGADISATTNIVANTFTGALTGNVTGNVTGNLTGTIQTAAQPNITSVGTLTGLTTTGDINFGDNDKAVFGAGSDLEIFHNGTTSYIRDVGDGDLQLFATDDVYIRGYATNNYMARFNENGAVTLYHNNSSKLATTSTGINVTGTVTADGLTVVGETFSSNGTYGTKLTYSNGNQSGIIDTFGNHNLEFRANNDRAMNIAANGDISFYEDTGTTAKLFWDASAESLGIGTSSPSAPLDVVGSGKFQPGIAGGDALVTIAQTNVNAYVHAGIKINAGNTNPFYIYQSGSSNTLRFNYNSLSDAGGQMLLTDAGRLLVGTTSTTPAFGTGTGIALVPTGESMLSANSVTTLFLNRTTSDGDILDFRKDGSQVGKIGSTSGVVSHIILDPRTGVKGAGLLGSSADANTGILQPVNHSGALADGAIQLGTSSNRFKDLYLSGGAYIGGTGSANHLDDYEEGTFTPVMTGVTGWSGSSGVSGEYTKIGNTVHIYILMTSNVALTGTAGSTITGLPFTNNRAERCSNVSVSRMFGINLTTTDYIAGVVGTEIQFSYVNGNNNVNNFTHTGSTLRLTISATYQTA